MMPFRRGRPYKYNPANPHSSQPPAKAGEYRIKNAKNEIKYIGIASDLKRRMNQHKRSGKFQPGGRNGDVFEYQIAQPGAQFEDLCSHERNKIAQHNPTDNKRAGGAGRRTLLGVTKKQC